MILKVSKEQLQPLIVIKKICSSGLHSQAFSTQIERPGTKEIKEKTLMNHIKIGNKAMDLKGKYW